MSLKNQNFNLARPGFSVLSCGVLSASQRLSFSLIFEIKKENPRTVRESGRGQWRDRNRNN